MNITLDNREEEMKETEQKIRGQWFTPDNIADEMVKMTPNDWWSKGILEPTCGNGNLVIRILDEKVKHGLTPEEALNTTFANEIDEKYAIACSERVREWAEDKGFTTHWTCMNEDAQSYDFSQIPYEYVWTNLPFGSFDGNLNQFLPNRITKNVVKSEGILITKPTTFKKFVKDYKIVDFPGVVFKCQISHYDLTYNESKSWIDKYKSIMTKECKWEVKDNSYTHVISLMTNANELLRTFSRDFYDKKGKLPSHRILLKLTEDEYNKLISYKIPDIYNEYMKERSSYTIYRKSTIVKSLINEALS